jgi:hypothetical protein
MKVFSYLSLVVLTLLFVSCSEEANESTENSTNADMETISYASFGDSITTENAISGEELLKQYKNIQEGDTLDIKFSGVIQKVCQKKGCWMNVRLSEEDEAFIKFKDYGFFMPLNAAESEAIVNGKAFVSVVPVEELQHYAEDEGQSAEEIAAITEPEVTYGFLADGVLIKE